MAIIDVTTVGVVAGSGSNAFTGVATVISGGSGYTTQPSVSITGGGGSGATAVAILGASKSPEAEVSLL